MCVPLHALLDWLATLAHALHPAQGGGAYIVRLAAGNPEVYLRKELLWPYIREFADRALEHVRQQHRLLQEEHGQACRVVCVHGHYADAAEIACMMAATLGTTVAVTGHSLGRNKLENILKGGKMTRSETEAQYRIGRRIEAEERALDGADVIFTSTAQEIEAQWGLYDGFDAQLQRALTRTRRATGRWMPRLAVIPPGLDFARVKPVDLEAPPEGDDEPAIWREIARFLRNPRKPAILALARPDAKKNLVRVFARCCSSMHAAQRSHSAASHSLPSSAPSARTARFASLQTSSFSQATETGAQLAHCLQAGVSADAPRSVDAMSAGARRVMEGVLKQIDALDLYGSVAIPKHHSQDDITHIYACAYCLCV